MTNDNQLKNSNLSLSNSLEVQLRIMIVDDYPEMRRSMSELLKKEGHEVVQASSAKDALEKIIEDSQLDVIVSDYNMPPGKNGIELKRQIEKAGLHIPFILFSGNLDGISEADFSSVDLYALLEKPRGFTSLMSYIQDIQEEKAEKIGPYFGVPK